MDQSLSVFFKRHQRPIFFGVPIFAVLLYLCHSYFDELVRHSGNHQVSQYLGLNNADCYVSFKPSGRVRAGKQAELVIDEIWPSCNRQPSLPPSTAASIRKDTNAVIYRVSFVAEREGSMAFTLGNPGESSLAYIYTYKADPAPIWAILLEVFTLAPASTLLVLNARRQIRVGKKNLRKRNEDAAPQVPAEQVAAEVKAESQEVIPAPLWLDPTVTALTQYGKLITAITAVVYIAGIFVVNAFLSRWGASDYSLIKPRVLLTGLWLLFFLSLCILPFQSVFGKAFKAPAPRENDGTIWFLLSSFCGSILRIIGFFFALCFSAIPLTVIAAFFIAVQRGSGDFQLDPKEFLVAFALVVGAQFVGSLISEHFLLVIHAIKDGKWTKQNAEQTVINAVGVILFLLFFAFVFSRTIYAGIPDTFGGGGGRKEIILFKDLDDKTLDALKTSTKCVYSQDNAYNVAFSGDNYVLLACSKSGRYFKLDRKYIAVESWPRE